MLLHWANSGSGGAAIMGLSPAAWFRYGQGITVTGSGVSQWNDASGNARHLLQGTDTNRPALNADSSVLFDGVDNAMATATFTLNQPCTFYLLYKQVTWTASDAIFDGVGANGVNNCSLFQATGGAAPQVNLFAGTTLIAGLGPVVGAYGVSAVVFSGASSLHQLNNGTPTTGDAGLRPPSGITLGSNLIAGGFSNIEVKELLAFGAAHDAAQRAVVNSYLARVGGL